MVGVYLVGGPHDGLSIDLEIPSDELLEEYSVALGNTREKVEEILQRGGSISGEMLRSRYAALHRRRPKDMRWIYVWSPDGIQA